MKRIFTFLFLMGMITSGFAQWQNGGDRGPKFDNRNDGYGNGYRSSAVVIKAFTERCLTVMIDNMQYQLNDYGDSRRDNFINVGALTAGKHTITVYETRAGFFGKQRQRELYCGPLFLKPGVETSLNVNNYGQVAISEKQSYNGYGRDDRRDHDRDHDRWDEGRH